MRIKLSKCLQAAGRGLEKGSEPLLRLHSLNRKTPLTPIYLFSYSRKKLLYLYLYVLFLLDIAKLFSR